MSYHVDLDTRRLGGVEDYRPYPARHRAPEKPSEPVQPPPWALEQTGLFRLPGESTVQLVKPELKPGELEKLRLPSRAPSAALAAVSVPVHRPKTHLLGRCLHALRHWGRS